MAMRSDDVFDIASEETPVTDDELLEIVENLFAEDERVDDTLVEVYVKDGVVRLEGSVSTAQELEMAESLLDDIEGIIAVENHLQVVLAGYTEEDKIGPAEGQYEEEFEGVEVLEPDEKLVTEDVQEAIEDGKAWVPPNEPIFPTERGDAGERFRERVAEKEATGDAPDKL